MAFLRVLHLDHNRPSHAIAYEVILLIKEAFELEVLHLLGEHGYTHLRLEYLSLKAKAVLKKMFKKQDTFIRFIDTISKQVVAETKTKK